MESSCGLVERGGAASPLVLVYVAIRLSESQGVEVNREIQHSGHDTTIVALIRGAVRMGRQQALWKRARGVVICKPGKDHSTKLQEYLSISLLRCIGKVVEKVVVELFSQEAERRGLLSDGQFGAESGG